MRSWPIATVARVAVAILACIALSAAAQDIANLPGTWEHKGAAGETITFTLNPDGSAKIDDESAKYTVAGDTIAVVIEGETIRYAFKIEGDSMTVSGGDLDRPTTFTRKAAPKRGLGARIKGGAGDTKSDAPKPHPFDVPGAVTGDASQSDKPAMPKPATAAATPFGTWSADDGDKIEIRESAIVYQGTAIPAKDT